MLNKIVEYSRQIVDVVRKQQKHEEDIKGIKQELREIRQDINHLREEFHDLARTVERLAYEIHRDRERADDQRRIQQLELDLRLLRFERGLPPGESSKDELPKDKD